LGDEQSEQSIEELSDWLWWWWIDDERNRERKL